MSHVSIDLSPPVRILRPDQLQAEVEYLIDHGLMTIVHKHTDERHRLLHVLKDQYQHAQELLEGRTTRIACYFQRRPDAQIDQLYVDSRDESQWVGFTDQWWTSLPTARRMDWPGMIRDWHRRVYLPSFCYWYVPVTQPEIHHLVNWFGGILAHPESAGDRQEQDLLSRIAQPGWTGPMTVAETRNVLRALARGVLRLENERA